MSTRLYAGYFSNNHNCNNNFFKLEIPGGQLPCHVNTYLYNLDDFLSIIDVPYDCINCTNLLCTNIIQTSSNQILHDQIILLLLRSSEIIPETGTKSKIYQDGMIILNI